MIEIISVIISCIIGFTSVLACRAYCCSYTSKDKKT